MSGTNIIREEAFQTDESSAKRNKKRKKCRVPVVCPESSVRVHCVEKLVPRVVM
jgi:hypothetical protein